MFNESLIEKKRIENVLDQELQQVLQDPTMLPQSTKNNIDQVHCDYSNMFKSPQDREVFYLHFKQQCIFKKKCTVDSENMLVNMSQSASFKKEQDEEMQLFKLS